MVIDLVNIDMLLQTLADYTSQHYVAVIATSVCTTEIAPFKARQTLNYINPDPTHYHSKMFLRTMHQPPFPIPGPKTRSHIPDPKPIPQHQRGPG